MEATNISIKQQSSVSINVETLQASVQNALKASKQATDIDAMTDRLEAFGRKTARRMERVVEEHPVATDIAVWLMGLAFMVEIFLYA